MRLSLTVVDTAMEPPMNAASVTSSLPGCPTTTHCQKSKRPRSKCATPRKRIPAALRRSSKFTTKNRRLRSRGSSSTHGTPLRLKSNARGVGYTSPSRKLPKVLIPNAQNRNEARPCVRRHRQAAAMGCRKWLRSKPDSRANQSGGSMHGVLRPLCCSMSQCEDAATLSSINRRPRSSRCPPYTRTSTVSACAQPPKAAHMLAAMHAVSITGTAACTRFIERANPEPIQRQHVRAVRKRFARTCAFQQHPLEQPLRLLAERQNSLNPLRPRTIDLNVASCG